MNCGKIKYLASHTHNQNKDVNQLFDNFWLYACPCLISGLKLLISLIVFLDLESLYE